MSDNFWYDGNKTLTHNCLFNFLIGSRGTGKTYWCTEWSVKDFIKTGSQFIYLRRYEKETKLSAKKYFDAIIRDQKFPDHKLEVKGNTFLIDDKVAGYAIALSTARGKKSISFPLVNKIIFDEFIIDKGNTRYLPNEVEEFLDFYETVARMRDVRVFFAANAITMVNPYFLYFDVPQRRNGQTYLKPKKDVLIEFVENKSFMDAKRKTRFGQLIDGTKYSHYAIDNKFLRDSDTFIEKKSGNCSYYFTFIYHGTAYGIWCDYTCGMFWVSEDTDPCFKIVYTITMADHTPNTMLLKNVNKSFMFRTFIDNYKLGNVRFESVKIKNIINDIIKMSLT